jgi:hypothetical protein
LPLFYGDDLFKCGILLSFTSVATFDAFAGYGTQIIPSCLQQTARFAKVRF